MLVRSDDPTPYVESHTDGSLSIVWPPRPDPGLRQVTDKWPEFVAVSRELLELWVAELSEHRVASLKRRQR